MELIKTFYRVNKGFTIIMISLLIVMISFIRSAARGGGNVVMVASSDFILMRISQIVLFMALIFVTIGWILARY